MAIQTKRVMSVADYLEWETGNEIKHEYIDGEVFEMSGATSKHNKIAVNVMFQVLSQVNRASYIVFNSDMRVNVGANRYVYPDLSVVRGPESYENESELTLLNPAMVVEVTSPSSATYDHVDKLDYYFDVPSIEAYLIVDQDRVRAHLYTRAEEGWLVRVYSQPEDVIPLSALNCELPLAQVYRGIEFAEA